MQSEKYKNKVVAITGGSDGIGKALVEQYLQAGAKVATCGRSQQKLDQLASAINNENLFCIAADVSKFENCEHFINASLNQFGKIDILINNAGISMRSELKDASIEVFKQVMDINYFGTVYCTKLALDSIIANRGSIVGVSSIAGYRGLPGRSGYSASKFAVNGFLEALRTELLDEGVNVMWVCPGFTKSNIRNAALDREARSHGETPMNEESLMTSEECAKHIINAIDDKKRTLVLTFTGKRTVFMNKFFPAWTDRLTRKFFYKDGQLAK